MKIIKRGTVPTPDSEEDNLVKNTWGWSNQALNAELCK